MKLPKEPTPLTHPTAGFLRSGDDRVGLIKNRNTIKFAGQIYDGGEFAS